MNQNLVGSIYVHSLERTFHRCFLPGFSSFGWGFSEEKIKMWKVNGWQMTDTKWWQKLILHYLVGSIYVMSSMKIAHFVLIGLQTWPPHAILVSDWSISKKSSPLKLLSHMNRNSDGKSSYCIWQGLLKRILKCEYQLVMYRINMLHYISIS
jgi:hypothetical protein